MRDIKFRGQRQSDNKWIYGDLLQPTEICDIYEISDCESIDGSRYDVIKETIGQYTGLHDKNGKEIYEGDIVKHNGFYEGDCYYNAGCGQVLWDDEDTGFYLTAKDTSFISLFDLIRNLDGEVIGNIWENGDLLNDSK